MAEKTRASRYESHRTSVKYRNRFLFDYSREELDLCMNRLDLQAKLYASSSKQAKRRMRVRALFTAALTLNATAVWTAKLILRGNFSMSSQRVFFVRRWRMDPALWGQNPKSCFARALCGYSLGADAVCVDRHLERMDLAPSSAAQQWMDWFRLYESMYGPGETLLCARWHIHLLDWIASLGPRPATWK